MPTENTTKEAAPTIKRYPISRIVVENGLLTEEERNYLNSRYGFHEKVSKPKANSMFFKIFEYTQNSTK